MTVLVAVPAFSSVSVDVVAEILQPLFQSGYLLVEHTRLGLLDDDLLLYAVRYLIGVTGMPSIALTGFGRGGCVCYSQEGECEIEFSQRESDVDLVRLVTQLRKGLHLEMLRQLHVLGLISSNPEVYSGCLARGFDGA